MLLGGLGGWGWGIGASFVLLLKLWFFNRVSFGSCGVGGAGPFLARAGRAFVGRPFFLVILFLLLAQAEVPMRRSVYLEPMIELLGTNLLMDPSLFGGDQLSLVCALAGSVSRSMNVESEW